MNYSPSSAIQDIFLIKWPTEQDTQKMHFFTLCDVTLKIKVNERDSHN